MNKTETADYRRRLLALQERLDSDISQLKDEALQPAGGEASGSLSNVPLHLADLGSHAFEEDLTLGLLQNAQETIGEINAALLRMEQGVYGRCETCQKQISRGRLHALPYTRHCVDCARKLQENAAP